MLCYLFNYRLRLRDMRALHPVQHPQSPRQVHPTNQYMNHHMNHSHHQLQHRIPQAAQQPPLMIFKAPRHLTPRLIPIVLALPLTAGMCIVAQYRANRQLQKHRRSRPIQVHQLLHQTPLQVSLRRPHHVKLLLRDIRALAILLRNPPLLEIRAQHHITTHRHLQVSAPLSHLILQRHHTITCRQVPRSHLSFHRQLLNAPLFLQLRSQYITRHS